MLVIANSDGKKNYIVIYGSNQVALYYDNGIYKTINVSTVPGTIGDMMHSFLAAPEDFEYEGYQFTAVEGGFTVSPEIE